MDKKYCTECGAENEYNAGFCIGCGHSFETKQEEPVTEVTPVVTPKPQKKKKKKGGLVALIVIVLIAGLIAGGIFLYKKLTYFEDPFPDTEYLDRVATVNNYTSATSFTTKIEEDYKNGVINTDKYMLQLAYSIYDPVMLDPAYSSLINDYNNPRELFEKFETNLNQLSYDTAKYIFGKMTLGYVQWDVEVPEDNKSSSIYNAKIQNVMDPSYWPETLDSVMLSKDGHFLLYYDSKGKHPVDKGDVKEIGDTLEDAIKKYEKEYGLKYEFESVIDPVFLTPHAKLSRDHAAILLMQNNIDTKYLSTAMPVYFVNIGYSSPVKAFYTASGGGSISQLVLQLEEIFPGWLAGDEDDQIFTTPDGEMMASVTSGTYTMPFITVNSQIDRVMDTELVAAHELFHHYQHYICGEGNYEDCKSGGFTIETTANLVAVESFYKNKKGTEISAHSADYSKFFIENSVDTVRLGYPGYVFAYNYKEIVPDGMNKLFNSLKNTNALLYLYTQSPDKYKDVVTTTSEKALTLDYKNKEILPYYQGSNEPVFPKSRAQLLNYTIRNDDIEYTAMHYYYVDPSIYENSIQLKVSKTSEDNVNLVLQMFIKKGNHYQLLYTHDLNEQFVINMKDFKGFGEFAFAVVNTSPNTNYNYNITTNIGTDKPTVTPEDLKLKSRKTSNKTKKSPSTSSIVCYKVEDQEYIKATYQIKVSFDNKDIVNDMYVKGTVEMAEENTAFKLAKTLVTGLVFVVKRQYKEQFKYVTLRTKDEGNKYIILGRINKDYYEAIKNSFNTESTSKEDIFNAIQNEGYTCQYE